jgi:hypothetical protein
MRRQNLPKVSQKYLKTAWVDEVHEMTAIEVKGRDPLGNCRNPQSSKRGHAVVRKIGRPGRMYG